MEIWVTLTRFLKVGGAPMTCRRPAVNQYTVKFLVGLIVILLPFVELLLTGGWGAITSISESYWFDDKHWPPTVDWIDISGWPRTVFTGSLFAITAMLLGFNGESMIQGILARVAAGAAACIALFPCKCRFGTELIDYLHYLSAGVMYAVLAWFCLHFMARAQQKIKAHTAASERGAEMPPEGLAATSNAAWNLGMNHEKASSNARRRRDVYALCLAGMSVSIIVLAFQKALGTQFPSLNPVVVGESGGLVSFGLSWIIASRAVPLATTKGIDRESLF